MIDLLNSGAVDIGNTTPPYLASKMPMSTAFDLPFAILDAQVGTEAYMEVIKDKNSVIYQTDYEENSLEPLFVATLPPHQIVTTDPVEKVEDLKGLKIRSGGGAQDFAIQAIEAIPVSVQRAEVYTALERGTIDGGIENFPAVMPNKVNEVAKYAVLNSNIAGFSLAWTMDKNRWDSLPEDVKKVLKQAGEEASHNYGENTVKENEKAIQSLTEDGVQFTSFSEEEIKVLGNLLEHAKERWEESLAEYPTDKAISEVENAVEEVIKKNK